MLRTLVRNNLLRSGLKRVIKGNTVRCIGIAVQKCRHRTVAKRYNGFSYATQPASQASTAGLPKHTRVTLPALSPTMELGTIISWEKKEGDKLNEGDLLAEIETDKATMGFETPEEGYLAKILIPAGTKDIPIGKLVCIIVEKKEDVAAFANFKDDGSAVAAKPAAAPAPAAPAAPKPAPATAAPPIAPAKTPAAPAAAAPADGAKTGRVYASPMAKKLAEAQKIRLEGSGSGPHGSITSKDLAKMKPAEKPAEAAPPLAPSKGAPATPTPNPYIDIPVTNMRATIAKRLLESKVTIPHYYVSIEIDMEKVLIVREKLNKQLEKQKLKLSINDFVIKASAMALKRIPEANTAWMGKVMRQYVNADISVAVAAPAGLITPIIFNADGKGLIEISNSMKELAGRARSGKLQPHEFQGGTFTVSNLGMMDVINFCPIINPPQACILGVGCQQKRLVLDPKSKNGFKEKTIMAVTISADHRVLDGAKGAEWLKVFRANLEDPYSMLL